MEVDSRPLWQQHRATDENSFGVYSDMMVNKADSYVNDLNK